MTDSFIMENQVQTLTLQNSKVLGKYLKKQYRLMDKTCLMVNVSSQVLHQRGHGQHLLLCVHVLHNCQPLKDRALSTYSRHFYHEWLAYIMTAKAYFRPGHV